MKKWTLINKKTTEPIKVSVAFVNDWDVSDIFFFTESKNGFYWFVDTQQEVLTALEDYKSYIYNSPQRPFFDDLNKEDYFIKEVEIV
jgi:hypothetical protein